MPTRGPDTERPGLQLTWLDGDVVAWQPGRTVHGGNLYAAIRGSIGAVPAQGAGSTRVARLFLPHGELSVMCQRLDIATLAGLARLRALDGAPSASVAWFGSAFQLAEVLVRRGRALPRLVERGDGWWQATWVPLRADVDAVIDHLVAAMPAVVGAGEREGNRAEVARAVVDSLVDQIARATLAYSGWQLGIGDTRRHVSRALRQVMRALQAPVGRFRDERDLVDALDQIADAFDTIIRRAEGEPVVRVRLRLGLPEHPDGDWPLQFEMVDASAAGGVGVATACSLADVRECGPAARQLAGGERHLGLVNATAEDALADLSLVAPWLEQWIAAGCNDTIDIDQAAATLEAVDLLAAVQIDLLSPERLTRRRPTTRGTARPADEGAHHRFGATALVDWSVEVDDTPVDEAVLHRAAGAGASLVQVGGRWVQLDRTDARRALEHLARHRAQHAELSAVELLQVAAELGAAEPTEQGLASFERLTATGWLDDLLRGLPDTTLGDGEVPASFAATLRPYQLRGLAWLQFLHRVGLGGCLADDMGLGKTPTTLAHLAGLPGPHLVVCPLSVVHNWETEAARFVPLARVLVHHGSGRADAESFAARVAHHDLVVTTYQLAARDLDALMAVPWSTVVLDEAQAIKNPETAAAKAVRRIPAGQRIALTGTPVENRLSELWSIVDAVAPGLLGNRTSFRTRFGIPIERHRDPEATAALRQLTAPFVLRRTKADKSLVPDLPDKVEQIAWAHLTREQAAMYQAVVDQLLLDAQDTTGMRRRGLVLAALTRLKQICNHPAHALGDGSTLAGRSGKLARFDELVTDLLDAGERALVFTQFRQMGDLLQRHLGERFGHDRLTRGVPFLHGGVPRTARDRMVAEFQDGSSSPLLLVSLKAGGTGLNLTAASRVVHFDRWWNPAVEDQATDRAWRIGQTQSVFVHKLVCQGTVEERVDALINDKRALADSVVGAGSGETWLSELSTDALRDLVVLDRSGV
ncbi:MAG: DEAD/DEAH box helicase [Ilumatobacteraceae bacterium]